MITKRRFLRASAVTAGIGLGLGLYTWRVEPHWVEVVERPLQVANLPEHLAGTRLVQLSDLHIGPRVDDAYLLRVFDRVKELAPEIVVYTGDFTSYEADGFAHAIRMFAHLPVGSRATFGIPENHDYGPGWAHPDIAEIITALACDVGVRVLRNEVAQVDGLQVVGFDDLWAHRFEPVGPLAALDPGRASLVLSHNPDTADQPGWGTTRAGFWPVTHMAVSASLRSCPHPCSLLPTVATRVESFRCPEAARCTSIGGSVTLCE